MGCKHIEQLSNDLPEGAILSTKVHSNSKENRGKKTMYGFIECYSVEVAKDLSVKLQFTKLDGNILKVSFTGYHEIQENKSPEANGNRSNRTLIIKNIAFEATRKDIIRLFEPYGKIKSCRLPKKFDGNHRVFGFVEMSKSKEINKARNALANS